MSIRSQSANRLSGLYDGVQVGTAGRAQGLSLGGSSLLRSKSFASSLSLKSNYEEGEYARLHDIPDFGGSWLRVRGRSFESSMLMTLEDSEPIVVRFTAGRERGNQRRNPLMRG